MAFALVPPDLTLVSPRKALSKQGHPLAGQRFWLAMGRSLTQDKTAVRHARHAVHLWKGLRQHKERAEEPTWAPEVTRDWRTGRVRMWGQGGQGWRLKMFMWGNKKDAEMNRIPAK